MLRAKKQRPDLGDTLEAQLLYLRLGSLLLPLRPSPYHQVGGSEHMGENTNYTRMTLPRCDGTTQR
jgi:hypothetical protein